MFGGFTLRTADGAPVALPVRAGTMMAALVMARGAAASSDGLISLVWGDEAPRTARNQLHRLVSQTRRLLEPDLSPRSVGSVILGAGDGYRLCVEDLDCDLYLFDATTEAARVHAAEGRQHESVRAYIAALELARRPAFSGSEGQLLLYPDFVALERDRASTASEALALTLAGELSPRLLKLVEDIAAQAPFDEVLQARLVRTMGRVGRRSDALTLLQVIRERLRDELGLDPGTDLQLAQEEVLRLGDETVHPGPASSATQVPAQLPAGPAMFVGREAETQWLWRTVGADSAAPRSQLVTIGGMGGIGKTTAALGWAHRLVSDYPDGQLYANLRGFDPARPPSVARDVLGSFLEALGATEVPERIDDQAALYRSLMATRRMLVVLDNARDEDQVRPLLPGGPESLVLVTSRNPLVGLVANDGAHPLSLNVFTSEQSRDYLADRIGSARITAEPDAVDVLVRHCAGLPLALAIVAARAKVNPRFSLSDLADEIGPEPRVDRLPVALDAASDVHAVFSWSYGTLSADAADAFRKLAWHPGAHVSGEAVMSIIGRETRATSRLLAELVVSHLVTEHRPGRYAMHDLVRAYAQEMSPDPGDRRTLVGRAVDHCLRTGVEAVKWVSPQRPIVPLPKPAAGVRPQTFSSRDDALTWFGNEQQVISDVLREAHRLGLDRQVWSTAWAVFPLLDVRGRWYDALGHHLLALESATRQADRRWTGIIHQGLCVTYYKLEQHDQVAHHAHRAIAALEEVHDARRLGDVWMLLAISHQELGSLDQATEYRRRAAAQYRSVGDLAGEAAVLNNHGFALLELSDGATAAATAFSRSYELLLQTGQSLWAAITLTNIARAHERLGRLDDAVAAFETAIAELHEFGEIAHWTEALIDLGVVHHRRAGHAEAARVWRRADDALTDIHLTTGNPALERLHDRVRALMADAELGGL